LSGLQRSIRAEAPWADFHTYSFLWLPDEVPWFIDGFRVFPDQSQIQKLINSVPTGNKGSFQGVGDVPQFPAYILLNQWTNGDATWSGGPPVNDSFMTVHQFQYAPLTPSTTAR
jgi:beta-glucanase (GH16 family)